VSAIVFQRACKMGLEGVVSKRLSAPYRSGPSTRLAQGEEPGQPGHGATSRGPLVMQPPRDYGWKAIESAPLDEEILRPDPHVLEAGARRGCQGRPSLWPGRTLRRFQAAP
jgi:hypothetical protein